MFPYSNFSISVFQSPHVVWLGINGGDLVTEEAMLLGTVYKRSVKI